MRILLPIGVVASVLVAIIGPAAGCGGVALPPGAVTGSVCPAAPANKCSADGTFYVVTGSCCGFANCPKGDLGPAYALCDGTSFSACTCTEPNMNSGWTIIHPMLGHDAQTYPDIVIPDTSPPPEDSTNTDAGPEGGPESGGDTAPTDTGTKDVSKDSPTSS